MLSVTAHDKRVWLVAAMALIVCSLETGLRLGAASPDTRFTLPWFSLGYFWDTPLGWTGLVDGVEVNKDSVQFASLAGFFRDEPAVPVPPQDNVYVRFAGYALLGSVLAPIVGAYTSFVVVNLFFWVAAALATYALAMRHIGSRPAAALAALLVSTAPVFAALAGQALPYVASYGLFVLSLLLFDRVGLFGRDTPATVALASGLAGGMGFLFYDLYMLPAFVVVYGLLRRMPPRSLALLLLAMLVPRLCWSLYWQAAQLASYSHNEQHPIEALFGWFDPARTGEGLSRIRGYALLAAHGVLNIGAVFLFWPVVLAAWELWLRRRSPEALWLVAVLVAGFAPALFMLSTWPHIPRWYAYGFPAVYILAAAAAVRVGRWFGGAESARRLQMVVTVVVVLPAIVLANLDALGFTRPMELLLFQPTSWSYLWSP
jgi:4-amino-4-deoxy-L-arabinose transferase-like glycosyltransferase